MLWCYFNNIFNLLYITTYLQTGTLIITVKIQSKPGFNIEISLVILSYFIIQLYTLCIVIPTLNNDNDTSSLRFQYYLSFRNYYVKPFCISKLIPQCPKICINSKKRKPKITIYKQQDLIFISLLIFVKIIYHHKC